MARGAASPRRVRPALRAQLIEVKRQSVLATRYFELFETARSEDAYGGVLAANLASARLNTEMVEWLDTSVNSAK